MDLDNSAVFNNLDFHQSTIEINANQKHLDLQKDNHLLEFNQLEDIYNFCNPRNTILVKLRKGLRGLGISLFGGKKFQVEDHEEEELESSFSLINQLIRVKKLYPAQPAYECGLIEENDFILDVNGTSFVGLTYIEAFNILHATQDEVFLKILKFNQCPLELKNFLLLNELNESSLNNSNSFKETNIFESTKIDDFTEQSSATEKIRNKITLIKKDGSLGFILSKIENEGFYIKQITKEPASSAIPKINPGDRILSVNNTSLDGLDLPSAISFLRSLPDLCELELEQTVMCDSLDHSLNYNDQSETEEDNKLKRRQLRHEVKIMLDNRSKDTLHNRLKRKDLKKSKESTKDQKIERNNQSVESNSTQSSLDENNHRLEKNNNLEKDKFDKEILNVFMKLTNDKTQILNGSSFHRQSSVIDFRNNENSRHFLNENSFNKTNNLNKWRNTVLNDEDDNLDFMNANLKKNKFKDLNDLDEDSGFCDSMNKTNNNLSDSSIIMNTNEQNQDLIQLSDIQLKLNNNCLINENSKLYRNIDALFFYVELDRIRWHGRLGFSLIDDQSNDYRIVNTMKYGFSACVVKEIYPNSLAFSNGNIKVGDKLLEVNNQQMINKPVQTVIKDLRKMKGKLRLLFLRKRKY